MKSISFVFFGTGPLAESVLASLVRNGYTPSLVVTKRDTPQGRHMEMKSPHIKTWCDLKGIQVLQPEKLDDVFNQQLVTSNYQLFIVASYGKIIPESILNIPTFGVLNVHPSLLPLYRGASPIESALLDGLTETGVTIMKLDKEMDHGPILVQHGISINPQATAGTLEVECGQLGGELLAQVIPAYIEGTLIPVEQEHGKATSCKKIAKVVGEIKLTDNASGIQRKYRALTPWPGLFFFHNNKGKDIRVKVSGVDLLVENPETLVAKDVITKVVPEGKHEIRWEDFERGYLNS